MDLRVEPGGRVQGSVSVPGDKAIAHRWLVLASTAEGRSRIRGLPRSLDVRSTASCLARVAPGGPSLEGWVANGSDRAKGHGSTWNRVSGRSPDPDLEVEGDGWGGLRASDPLLDCGNSGTTMRLLAGVLAGAAFETALVGDESLSSRPMERVAEPLRRMGARVETTEGHAPVRIRGGALRAIRHRMGVPSAQVKSAILLAGLQAEGETIVEEPVTTRDHTERALGALGAPVEVAGTSVRVSRFQHVGFEATVPGDPSSAGFLVAAAALTEGDLTIRSVGLNPSRLGFVEVMARMGIRTEVRVLGSELGEPMGELRVFGTGEIVPVRVTESELPLMIDEVPALSMLAACARGESRFLGAGELRLKESDRLEGIVRLITGLGGAAVVEGSDLVVGGGGLIGGEALPRGDHRLAMAAAVAALAARGSTKVDGIECADVSFPGFAATLGALGARVEVTG